MQYLIEKASPGDYEAILKVMEAWNMHHVPSAEMAELDLTCFFVARVSGLVAGAIGYKLLSSAVGKTTLLAIRPEFTGKRIGRSLQNACIDVMFSAGIRTIITNADRPETILWYKKHYGYRPVGMLKKLCDFGLSDVDHWITLEMDIDMYRHSRNGCEDHQQAVPEGRMS
jgi:ribosomal-protein-alanine N-acetyltransferase